MAEINFKTRDELEAWLEHQPRAFAIVIAARAALHVVPLLKRSRGHETGYSLDEWRKFTLAYLRGIASTWLEAKSPSQDDARRVAADDAFAAADAVSVTQSLRFELFVRAAYIAAAYPAYAAESVVASAAHVVSDAASAAASNALAISFAISLNSPTALALSDSTSTASFATSAIWRAVTDDARLLVGADGQVNIAVEVLADRPLRSAQAMLGGSTALSRSTILAFDDELRSAGDDWDVWADWYQARLHGGPAFGLPEAAAMRVEEGIVLLPEDTWQAGPATVNAAIKALIAQERAKLAAQAAPAEQLPSLPDPALPPQDPLGVRFDLTDGPIDVAEDWTAADRLVDTPDRREDYADIRAKLDAIRALGYNRVGHLDIPLRRFLDLSEELAWVRAHQFWSRMNTLRIALQDHDASEIYQRETGDRDERRLDGVVAGRLRDAVETVNAFVLGDPELLARDARRPGPQEIVSATAFEAIAAPLAQAIGDRALTSPRAADELELSLQTAVVPAATLAQRQQAELAGVTQRNWLAALMDRAWRQTRKGGGKIKDGAIEEIGKKALDGAITYGPPVAGTFVIYIGQYASEFTAYVGSVFGPGSSVMSILQAILRVVGLG